MIYSTIQKYIVDICRGYTTSITTLVSKYGENSTFIILFTAAIILRFFVVSIVGEFSFSDPRIFLIFFLQDYLVFLISTLCVWVALALLMRIPPRKIFLPMTLAPFLAVMPPVIDLIATGGGGYWSFYLLSDMPTLWAQYTSFFGHLPPAIIYVGTRAMVLVAVIIATLFVYRTTRSVVRSFLGALIIYSIFFFFASFPSWLTFIYFTCFGGVMPWKLFTPDIAGFMLAPHPIFSTALVTISTTLSVKLNMLYIILMPLVFLWKDRLDATGGTKSIFSHNTWTIGGMARVVLYAFVPALFTLYSYSVHTPYKETFFSSMYFLLGVGVYVGVLFALRDTSQHHKMTLKHTGVSITLLVLAMLLLGYKMVFLLMALVVSVWTLRLMSLTYPFILLTLSSFFGALYFFVIFSPGHSITGFPWVLFVYSLSTLMLTGTMYDILQKKHFSTRMRGSIALCGMIALLLTVIFHMYTLLFVIVGLMWFVLGVAFFVRKGEVYLYMMYLYMIVSLLLIMQNAFSSL